MESTFWDDRYRTDEYAYGREPNELLRAEAHRIPRGRVLCLAEGEGRNAVFLAERGHDVTAVDFSTEGLRKAQRLARERNVVITTIQADLGTYEPELEAYSGIIAIFAHLPPTVRRQVHAWIPRALLPNGVFILEAYTPEQLALNTGGPRDGALLMTLAALKAELAPLTLELGREVTREVHEGAFHEGLSATVQLVAVHR